MTRKLEINPTGEYSKCRVWLLPHGLAPGFTLLEVMVSVAILGIGILMVVQLFSGGLGLASSARDHTDTVLFAKETMARAFIEDELPEGVTSGVSDEGYEWSVEVRPVDGVANSWLQGSLSSDENFEARLWDVTVTVYNPGTRRRFTLSSVRYDGKNTQSAEQGL